MVLMVERALYIEDPMASQSFTDKLFLMIGIG